ncbi:MAG: SDR family NAD(P)-dependent oxidoreductase [Hyphomicrobiales bacterium]
MRKKNLQKKSNTVVITGASSGIGKALAIQLVDEDHKVILLARNVDKLKSICDFLGTENAFYYKCDLNIQVQIVEVVNKIVHDHGVPDILVNNAGTGTFKRFHEMTLEELNAPVNVPFVSGMTISWAFLPYFVKEKRGHLIFITAPPSHFPFPYMMGYMSARFAIKGLSYGIREEYRKHNITSSLICFGQVKTDYIKHNDTDLNWYPRVRKFVRPISKEEAASVIIRSIQKKSRELIYPKRLRTFVWLDRLFPFAFYSSLRRIGLLKINKKLK